MESKVLVDVEALKTALSLIETREWPVKYMMALGQIALEFESAIDGVVDENKSANEA